MKTIIAGSRGICKIGPRNWDYAELSKLIERAVAESKFEISEVITGGAVGPDRAGEEWAKTHGLPVTTIKPNWQQGGRGAGYVANQKLSEVGEALIALYDGESKGTKDMISRMRKKGAKVHVLVVRNKAS